MFLDVFKEGELLESIAISASKRFYTVGRQAGLSDIVLTHSSISREQASLTVSASGSVVVTDLGSAQGTSISGKKIQPKKPHLLAPGRSLVFGKSTRIFKLREGSGGFVNSDAAVVAAKNEPLVEELLKLLRGETAGISMRPDGYAPLLAVAASSALAPFGCTPAAILEMVSKTKSRRLFEVRSEEDEQLVRACEGHADTCRVDAELKLRPCGSRLDGSQLLVHGARFSEINSLRSRGLGATDGAALVRLSTVAPRKGQKMPGMAKAADLLVHLSAASLQAEGVPLFVDLGATASAAEDAAASGSEAPLAIVAGCVAGETIGVWLFDKITNARDGSEMMGPDEIAPLREARAKEVEQRAKALEAEEEKKRKREQARREREAEAEAEEAKPVKEEKFNPYLAHVGLKPPPRASNMRVAPPPLRRNNHGGDDEDDD